MKFCPNCGAKLTEGAKFCSNCGFNLQSIEVETPGTVADTPEPDTENTVQAEPDQLTPRNAGKQRPRNLDASSTDEAPEPEEVDFNEKYATQLAYPRDKKICAIDGEKGSWLSQFIELGDGHFICPKHWDQVFIGHPHDGDQMPPLVEVLENLNNPTYVKTRRPEEQERIENAKAEAELHRQQLHERAEQQRAIKASQPQKQKSYFGGLRCPRCKSANILLIADDANVKKVKRSTSINLNPLHPLTMMNHHEKVIKKHSGAKIAAGLMTGGASLLVTGTHSNAAHQYHCQDCGKVWTAK